MTVRALIGLVLALTAGLVILLFVRTSPDGAGGTTLGVGVSPAVAACAGGGRCLPDVPWIDASGITHPRAELAGKIVVVNFWATWCHPCEQEIPDFVEVAARYRDQVVILGVMMDRPRPDPAALLNFLSDHDMAYPVIPVTDDIERAFHYPEHYPTTYVFDRDGHERTWKVHPMSGSELSEAIDQILRR